MWKISGLFLFMGACIIAISSCAGVSIERDVQDNLFTSSYGPKIAIKINPDFKYMGKFEATKSIATTYGQFEGRKVPVKYTGYLFCELGDNRKMMKMISINFSQILDQDTVQPGAPLKGISYDINPGILKTPEETGRDSYKTVANPLSHGMNKFIYDADFTTEFSIAGCYLFQTLKRIISEDSKILMAIDYAEDVENEGMCNKMDRPLEFLTEAQQKRLDEFYHNSKENIQILTNGEGAVKNIK